MIARLLTALRNRLPEPPPERLLRDLVPRRTDTSPHVSFAQCGEDLIVDFYCRVNGLGNPDYLDLGAFDPWVLSNTALFYLRGASGWVVEPNPERSAAFRRERPRDQVTAVGIASAPGELTYYRFDSETLNTFDADEARRLQQEEHHVLRGTQPVPVDTLAHLHAAWLSGRWPTFLSVDLEGSCDIVFEALRGAAQPPAIICAETIVYSRTRPQAKDSSLIELVRGLGYRVHADTWINTLFVRE